MHRTMTIGVRGPINKRPIERDVANLTFDATRDLTNACDASALAIVRADTEGHELWSCIDPWLVLLCPIVTGATVRWQQVARLVVEHSIACGDADKSRNT